jgi:eukaryotic-like serine/threonine-protein kinase
MGEWGPAQMSEEFQVPVDPGPPVDPLIGRILNDRFTLLERIGSGGMGRVYRALQSPLDRMVAVKILDSNYASGRDPNFQRRFFLEASLTARLKHPNTITVMDYGKTPDGIYFIAMEYVDGLTLSQVLTREGALPSLRALNIAQQICRSLREAHKLGIIHRDLKPANIMLLDEDADHDLVKVLDFGLVKSILPSDTPGVEDSGITQSGTLLGSPLYMAPEHARHLPSDTRSDIYSLGVMLYQMLAGRPPFLGQSIDVIVKHVHEPVKPFRVVRPDLSIPPEVEALVLRCLEKEPDARFQSMDEVLEAIRTAGVSGSVSGPRRSSTGESGRSPVMDEGDSLFDVPFTVENPAPRVRLWPWVLVTMAALVLSAAAAFLYLQLDPPPRLPPPRVAAPTTVSDKTPSPVQEAPPSFETSGQRSSVRFLVRSEPTGASVWLAGRNVGDTPLELDVLTDDDGVARALMTFRLEGFSPQTLSASGATPEVLISPTLQKLPASRRSARPSPGSSDYKSDPYD